jgi:hypothetical protein
MSQEQIKKPPPQKTTPAEAQQLAEDDAAVAEAQAKPAADTSDLDELLDEIDGLLEEQEVLTNFVPAKGRAVTAQGVESVALLRRAKATLEAVDDWGHPWSHNEYVREVELLLTDIDAALTDGYVPLAALREFIEAEAHSCPTCPPGSEDEFYVDVHSLELFLRQFDA